MTQMLAVPMAVGMDGRLADLGRLAAQLSAGLSEVFSSAVGPTSDDTATLSRWLVGATTASDRRRLEALAPKARLLTITQASAVTERLLHQRHREDLLVARYGDSGLLVLVPGTPGHVDGDRAARRARDIASGLLRHDPGCLLGVSGTVSDHGRLDAAWQDAVDAAELAHASRRCVVADEAWAEIGALRLSRAAAQLVPDTNPVRRLLDHDARCGTDFARTLLLWLEEGGDTAGLARRLHTHANTIRYRVRRAQELAETAGDPTAMLLTHVLLRHALPEARALPGCDGDAR